MYVCIHTYWSKSLYCISMGVYKCMYFHSCACVCLYVCVCVCMYVYVYVCVCVGIGMCVRVRVCIYKVQMYKGLFNISYYSFLWKRTSGLNLIQLMKGLPLSLQTEISFHVYKNIIRKVHNY